MVILNPIADEMGKKKSPYHHERDKVPKRKEPRRAPVNSTL